MLTCPVAKQDRQVENIDGVVTVDVAGVGAGATPVG